MAVATILIVEDDRILQKALKRLFEPEGYAVEITGDGNAALQAFRKLPPSVVILDLRLPGISGIDVGHAILSPPLHLLWRCRAL